MEQKRVDYICFISWYNNRKKLVSERGEKGTISESWLSLASRPSPKQQLQESGIIDFKGINSQLQIVPFQGIICKPSCSHKPAGTGGLIQNSLNDLDSNFRDTFGFVSPQLERSLSLQSIWHQGEAHLQTISSRRKKGGFRNEEQVSSMSCENCTWHTSIPAQPLVPFELAEKVQTRKHSLC